jgi:hypothetical protein
MSAEITRLIRIKRKSERARVKRDRSESALAGIAALTNTEQPADPNYDGDTVVELPDGRRGVFGPHQLEMILTLLQSAYRPS